MDSIDFGPRSWGGLSIVCVPQRNIEDLLDYPLNRIEKVS